MLDYFKELGVSREASQYELKNAYFNMTKKYPPEKYPKEYRIIRDAYETLKDKSKREEYILEVFDINSKMILEKGISLAKNERYDLAIENFEKVLEKYPDNIKVKKDLAVCLIKENNHNKGAKILKELIIREPNNIENYKLLINSYVENNDIKSLEGVLKKGINLKNTEVEFYIKLYEIYSESELRDYEKAINILKEGIENKNIDSQNYKLYLRLIDISDKLDCKNDFNESCSYLGKIKLKDNYEEVREYIFNLAYRVLKEFHFKNGIKLTSTLLTLIDETKDEEYLNEIISLKKLFIELYELKNDESIDRALKTPIYYMVINKFVPKDNEIEDGFKKAYSSFFNKNNCENLDLLGSVANIKTNHKDIYRVTKGFCNDVVNICSKPQNSSIKNNKTFNINLTNKDKGKKSETSKNFYLRQEEDGVVRSIFKKVLRGIIDK